MARPTRRDEAVLKKAAEKLVDSVIEWENRVTGTEVTDREYVEDILFRTLQYSYNYDGYSLAHDLERHGYLPNAELVEILEDADGLVGTAHRREVQRWVSINKLKPKYSVGDKVMFTDREKGEIEGEVTKIYESVLEYSVFCEALGHVREGCGTNGRILPEEALAEVADG